MSFNHARFKKVFHESGLTKSELGSIFGVSRQCVYLWFNGVAKPTQQTLIAREAVCSAGLLAAVERGVLPMRRVTDKKIRAERIKNMVQQLYQLGQPK